MNLKTPRIQRWPDIGAGILVGGHGRRLGSVDKARINVHGKPLLSRIIDSVAPCVSSVTLAQRDDQDFSDWPADTVVDARMDGGPLAGLVSLLRSSVSPWCWLIAVDMPRFDRRLLTPLATARTSASDAVFYMGPHGAEPVCALYHKRCLPHAEALLNAGSHALHTLLGLVPHVRVPYGTHTESALFNLNSFADWSALGAGTP